MYENLYLAACSAGRNIEYDRLKWPIKARVLSERHNEEREKPSPAWRCVNSVELRLEDFKTK